MKIHGEYILREVVGEYVLVPVGQTALEFNGIISLNEVGACIWKQLEKNSSRTEMLQAVLEEFDVSEGRAEADLEEFLQMLQERKLLEP